MALNYGRTSVYTRWAVEKHYLHYIAEAPQIRKSLATMDMLCNRAHCLERAFPCQYAVTKVGLQACVGASVQAALPRRRVLANSRERTGTRTQNTPPRTHAKSHAQITPHTPHTPKPFPRARTSRAAHPHKVQSWQVQMYSSAFDVPSISPIAITAPTTPTRLASAGVLRPGRLHPSRVAPIARCGARARTRDAPCSVTTLECSQIKPTPIPAKAHLLLLPGCFQEALRFYRFP